ncbi:hypothetical protein GJ744_003322 [Endocarpon pusillum]|uniref:DUF2231 domain-containing protein n=1 Tax=Endocarpon pusillum TaxID=364733 RepID=A0A8H7DY92_9EURO|nr:hypothetical protein GJ744_003322 [Endocarpon pusillum]
MSSIIVGSKPLHPATVHFPIAFLTTSWALDLLYSAVTNVLPKSNFLAKSLSPHLPTLTVISHYSLALGILSGVVSIVTGGAQLSKMISNGGIYEADGKTMRPKVKTAFVHAGMNDVAILTAAFSWWVRRGNVDVLTGAVVPTSTNVLISALSLPSLLYSADLGGKLVYNYGVGLSMGKKGKAN